MQINIQFFMPQLKFSIFTFTKHLKYKFIVFSLLNSIDKTNMSNNVFSLKNQFFHHNFFYQAGSYNHYRKLLMHCLF